LEKLVICVIGLCYLSGVSCFFPFAKIASFVENLIQKVILREVES
jgi:hypothetical protein